MMNLEYDQEVDAAYIYLEKPKKGQAKNTVQLSDEIILDYDHEGKLIGIEILNASKLLRREALKIAQ